jgi:hypothetical protein
MVHVGPLAEFPSPSAFAVRMENSTLQIDNAMRVKHELAQHMRKQSVRFRYSPFEKKRTSARIAQKTGSLAE